MITKRTVLITVSAIIVAAIAITVIFMTTSGISKADAQTTATSYVPQGAEYIKTERDGNVYEVYYRDNGLGREYVVDISRENGQILGISMESDRDHGGASAELTADEAEEAVRDEIANITSVKVYQENDDDGIFYDVEFTASDFYGSAEVNAETGAVVKYTIRYGSSVVIPSTGSTSSSSVVTDTSDSDKEDSVAAEDDSSSSSSQSTSSTSSGTSSNSSGSTSSSNSSGSTSSSNSSGSTSSSQSSGSTSSSNSSGSTSSKSSGSSSSNSSSTSSSQIISVDEVKSIVTSKIGSTDAKIVEIELDREDGILQYEGEAFYNGYEYEFEINATSGVIIKWKVEREHWD